MKLIYITNNRIPTEKAHGFQVIKMCEAFTNAGAQVELWIPKRFNAIKDSPFNYYNIREIFDIKKIPVVDLMPLSKFLGPVANFIESFSFAIFSYFRLPAGDDYLIYSRDQFVLWFLSFTNKKFVYEVHSFPGKPIFYGRIWRKAYKIITITYGIKNLIVKYGTLEDKIIVASDAVDLEFFESVSANKEELRNELNLPKDSFIVGYVGKFKTLEMEKGIVVMLEALLMVDKDVKMIFVGGEESEITSYKALANRFNVYSQSLFFGYQPHIKAIKYMKAADALVIPFPNKPHYAFYASPLKLFEYMAAGQPIIASDLPALREILNDKNSLFFKPDDAADLARSIKMLKSSQMLGFHLSQQALADIKEYTWDNRARRILEFIK